jgi:UDP-N-acetylmuramyl pentapeptide phosphotransferase/UDP-N-acetylglucosamine-1-phosphate transferase
MSSITVEFCSGWTIKAHEWAWIVFIPIVIFIVTAVSNGANITDGIDGLLQEQVS